MPYLTDLPIDTSDERRIIPVSSSPVLGLVQSNADSVSELNDVAFDAPSPASRQVGVQRRWVVNRAASNEPSVLLKEIVVLGDEMQLRFRYTRRESSGTSIYAAPPRHNDSMFIQHRNGSQRVYVVRAEGIANQLNETWVAGGRYRDYVLYFPPIDASWGPVSISEGNAMFSNSTPRFWFWKRVDLVSV
jgi:hypothetical protein